ncbi:MAG: ArsR family transcriptional regulator [Acidobacteria bacterium]|nr:ArsR family transcriptional regulator [Acidobacteriota bacterium]MCZ6753642.1 ArsR family transcriptional regulator [Acidobacteriota bacterium]
MAEEVGQDTTRQKILHFIKIKGRPAISDISQALGITPMAVRRHVLGLQSSGLLRMEMERRTKGRPAALCLLTDLGDSLFPKSYDRFSMELIQCLAQLDGEEKVNQLFEKYKERMVAKFAGRMEGKNREDRVREAVAILCEQGYMAESRKVNSETFLVTEHNCAIAHVARQYQQACQGELCFLAQILRAEVQRQAHILKGDSECSYLIQFPAQRKAARRAEGKPNRRIRAGNFHLQSF